MRIKGNSCLGGCCSGVIVKATGITNVRRKTLDVVSDEATALEMAKDLLGEESFDEEAFQTLQATIESGERAFVNSEPPEICAQCGSSLQLYRGNCAKCGKNPY